MATNYTEHYQLNQWEPEDKVLRTDFNADNLKIDGALHALSGEVAELKSSRNAQVYMITYTGNGSASRTFTFPSRPILVNMMGADNWVCALQGTAVGSGRYLAGGGGQTLTVSWSGYNMTVSSPTSDASYICNWSGEKYSIVAILDARY